MAIAFVQVGRNSGSSVASLAQAYGSNVAANNLLVAGVWLGSNTVTVSTIADTLGNVWKLAVKRAHATAAVTCHIYYCVTRAAGANTVTVTPSSSISIDLHVLEYSGLTTDVGLVLDQTSSGSGTGTSLVAGTVTSVTPNQLFFAYADGVSNGAETAGTNYTARSNTTNSGISEDHIVSVVTTEGATCTFGSSTGFCIVMATFSAIPVPTLVVPTMPDMEPPAAPIAGRNWPIFAAAQQLEEMTAWTQRIISLPQNFDDDDFANRVPFNLAVWTQPEDESSDWANDVFSVLPPFDPTTVPQSEQTDIYGRARAMPEEVDSPLNIFLPPPGWDDGFDFSFQPVMKLEEYREEGALPIIPSAFDDDFLFSFQPQMKIDDERDYQMVIIIPRIVYDDDWTQNWQQSPMKIDDERDYQVRIFLPNQVLDDDWQRAVSPQMKLEEVDNGLLIILPPFDPTVVPQAEQMDSPDMRALLRDDWTDSPLQLFLPPFDPTQRPAIEDGDAVINAQARWVDMEDGRALEIFLPPSPWTEDRDSLQKPQPPANLSVEPEGEWFNLIVVLPVPPDTGPIPGRSAFILVRGIHIKR